MKAQAPRVLEGDQPRRLRRRALGARPQLDQPRRLRDVSLYLNEDTERYLQRIRVTVRNLRTQTFVTAGVACQIISPRLSWLPLGDGTYASMSRELRRGDAYGALVYTPNPNGRERRDAAAHLPGDDAALRDRSSCRRRCRPTPTRRPPPPSLGYRVQFPLFGDPGVPTMHAAGRPRRATPSPHAGMLLRAAPYARTYALARGCAASPQRRRTTSRRCCATCDGDDFSYTESPSRAAENLDGFLFDAKSGYCQQYSGAMALLLRMGGVPARVSTGFTTGVLDRKAGEYVVRDFDAHSWVEVWYAGYGWVTMDPTPSAAPARSQADDEESDGRLAGDAGRSGPRRRHPLRPGAAALAAVDDGTPWTLIGFGAGGAGAARRPRRLAAAPPPPARRRRLGPGRRARAGARAHPPRCPVRPPR